MGLCGVETIIYIAENVLCLKKYVLFIGTMSCEQWQILLNKAPLHYRSWAVDWGHSNIQQILLAFAASVNHEVL